MEETTSYTSTVALSLGGNSLATPHFAVITAASAGDNALVTADPANKIRVLSYVITGSAAVNGKFRSGTTDISGLLYMGADTGAAASFSPIGHFETAKNAALNLNLSGAVAVGGHLVYILIPA